MWIRGLFRELENLFENKTLTTISYPFSVLVAISRRGRLFFLPHTFKSYYPLQLINKRVGRLALYIIGVLESISVDFPSLLVPLLQFRRSECPALS